MKFESFAPTENIEEGPKEERISAISRLTEKFPKFKSLILAFIASTAALSAPELAEAHLQSTPDATTIEHVSVETAEVALEKVADSDFQTIVHKVEAGLSNIDSNTPTNSVYSKNWNSQEINKGVTVGESQHGHLLDSGTNIFIGENSGAGHVSKTEAGVGYDQANFMDITKNSFYVMEAGKGTIIDGKTFDMQGIGSTKEEALQNALESAIRFLGVEVSVDNELDQVTKDEGLNSMTKDVFSEVITTSSKHFVKEYKLTESKELKADGGESEYHISVAVTGGTFTPENNN